MRACKPEPSRPVSLKLVFCQGMYSLETGDENHVQLQSHTEIILCNAYSLASLVMVALTYSPAYSDVSAHVVPTNTLFLLYSLRSTCKTLGPLLRLRSARQAVVLQPSVCRSTFTLLLVHATLHCSWTVTTPSVARSTYSKKLLLLCSRRRDDLARRIVELASTSR